MAIKMTTAAHLIFFEKIFYNKPDALGTVLHLASLGFVFNVGMFEITATNNTPMSMGQPHPTLHLPLITSSNVIMKYVGNGAPFPTQPGKEGAIAQVEAWVYAINQSVTSLGSALGVTPADVAGPWTAATPLPKTLKPGDKITFTPSATSSSMPYTYYLDKSVGLIEPFTEVAVALSDATKLGQRVLGTEKTSIYRVIALGELGINVAMRWEKGGYDASFRLASKNDIPMPVRGRIKKNAFEFKPGGHASLHLSIGDIPINRVMGAVLFGLDLKLKQHITSVEEVFTV